jgi:orotate phosphoribosyltransferase
VTTVRPALDAALRHTIALRTEAIFERTGAWREGSLELLRLLRDPAATGELCAFLAEHGRGLDRLPLVDVVVGPAIGGAVIAFETARQLGVRAGFAAAGPDGLGIEPGDRVLLVDDSLVTGAAMTELIAAVEAARGEIVECVVLVDRSGNRRATLISPTTGHHHALRSLWQLEPLSVEAGASAR